MIDIQDWRRVLMDLIGPVAHCFDSIDFVPLASHRDDNPMRLLVRLLVLMVTLVVSAGPVNANEGVAIPDGTAGMDVIVWRSEGSWERGVALLKAGQRDQASMHIACIVDRGTRVEFLQTGYSHATHRVLVLEGKHTGCEGNIKNAGRYLGRLPLHPSLRAVARKARSGMGSGVQQTAANNFGNCPIRQSPEERMAG